MPPTDRPPLSRGAHVRIAAISSWSLLLWGGWAFLANLDAGALAAAKAAATQGFISLTVTLIMTVVLETVSRACRSATAKLLLPTAAAVALHATYTVGLHWYAGTPSLILSVAPLLLAGACYSLTYAAGLTLASCPDAAIVRAFRPSPERPRGRRTESIFGRIVSRFFGRIYGDRRLATEVP